MDPFNLSNSTMHSDLPMGNALFTPIVFGASVYDQEYLNSLDDDTREYVLNHTSDFQSRDEVIEFVNRIHNSEG